jgi:hypothetical protein
MRGFSVLLLNFDKGMTWCAWFLAGEAVGQVMGAEGEDFGCFKKHRPPFLLL